MPGSAAEIAVEALETGHEEGRVVGLFLNLRAPVPRTRKSAIDAGPTIAASAVEPVPT